MSTYTYRYIEVLREPVDGVSWKKENLPSPEAHIGEIYKIGEYNRPEGVAQYYKSVKDGPETKWEPVFDIQKVWEPVRWFSYLPKNKVVDNNDPYYRPKYYTVERDNGSSFYIEEHLMWSDNGGYVRDDYISNGFNNGIFSNRGLPEDVSEEVKSDIESDEYAFEKTWVGIDEWRTAFDSAKKEFENEVQKRYCNQEKTEISKKLDDIYKAIKNPDYTPRRVKKKSEDDYFYEDSIEYLFEETIWKLFHIQSEIDRTEFIVDNFYNNFGYKNVRIIYYLA